MKMAEVRMTMEEYLNLLNGLNSEMPSTIVEPMPMPKKKRSTAYQRRYKANFKKVSKRFKLKNGKWKKNGFKSAVKLAHKMSRK
jgi:hypothetical protein